MKLQLTEQTIRLRLSDEEVRQFDQTGQLTHQLAFGSAAGQVLRYALRRLPPEAAASGLGARYAAGELVVEVPAQQAHTWAATGNISLKGEVVAADGQQLRLLVEKDLGPSH